MFIFDIFRKIIYFILLIIYSHLWLISILNLFTVSKWGGLTLTIYAIQISHLYLHVIHRFFIVIIHDLLYIIIYFLEQAYQKLFFNFFLSILKYFFVFNQQVYGLTLVWIVHLSNEITFNVNIKRPKSLRMIINCY